MHRLQELVRFHRVGHSTRAVARLLGMGPNTERQRRALRLFPLLRQGQPKAIVIDPRRAFGQPVLVGTGIPTAVIHERFHAGEPIRHLANDYGIRLELIEAALRAA